LANLGPHAVVLVTLEVMVPEEGSFHSAKWFGIAVKAVDVRIKP